MRALGLALAGLVAGLVLVATAGPSAARVHATMYCWEADSEFPVPCDDDGDEGDEGDERLLQGSGFRF
jgi:hypothetical protein